MDWNTVVTIEAGSYRRAVELLDFFGEREDTEYFNVLVMKVPDRDGFLARLERWLEEHPKDEAALSRVVWCEDTFDFEAPEEFRAGAEEAAQRLAPRLTGKSFHVRLHRRGFKGSLVSSEEERAIADAAFGALRKAGGEARAEFDDPDAVLVVETVDRRAGLAVVTRDEMEEHPLLDVR